jgi:hypothetical protein
MLPVQLEHDGDSCGREPCGSSEHAACVRSRSRGTTGCEGGGHGRVRGVLICLGRCVKDQLLIDDGTYLFGRRLRLLYFRLPGSPCGWTQILVLMTKLRPRRPPHLAAHDAGIAYMCPYDCTHAPIQNF